MGAIGNKNPSIRELIPDLMGGLGTDLIRQDPQRPSTTWLRTAHASTGIRTTYVVPGDWPGKPDDWFASDAPTYPLRKQNNMEYFIDGEPTFEAMIEAIETATGPDHFIILLGWACHPDFVLSKKGNRCPGAKRTFFDIVKERMGMGVLVRLLLYMNVIADNEFTSRPVVLTTKDRFDSLEPEHPHPPAVSKIRCFIDNAIKIRGLGSSMGMGHALSSHHQKILLVYGTEGLIGFFGGVDINDDRVNPTKLRTLMGPEHIDVHGPLHDVHARVHGEAAEDLLVLATNRWNFAVPPNGVPEIETGGAKITYPNAHAIEDMSTLLERVRSNTKAPPGPHHVVKVAHTVGNPALAKLQDDGVWPMVRHGIQQAKKFIYLEDQYFWSVDAAEELGKAAAQVAHVTILFTPDVMMPPGGMRYRALKRLKDVAGANAEKIRIYVVREEIHQYVHSKMWIFDDEYLLVGSANCNNRGYYTDSEVIGGVADPEWASETGPRAGKWWASEMNFAHKLRIQLWAEHLRLPPEWLIDGVAAELHWRIPSDSKARIEPYMIPAEQDGQVRHYLWQDYPYGDYEDSVAAVLADPKI